MTNVFESSIIDLLYNVSNANLKKLFSSSTFHADLLTRFDLCAISAAPIAASLRIWTTPNAATTAITMTVIARMATAVWSCRGALWRDDTGRGSGHLKELYHACVSASGSEPAMANSKGFLVSGAGGAEVDSVRGFLKFKFFCRAVCFFVCLDGFDLYFAHIKCLFTRFHASECQGTY